VSPPAFFAKIIAPLLPSENKLKWNGAIPKMGRMKYALDDLYLFKQVVDYGGISGSARSLSLPKSTIARRIAMLEQTLGQPLFHRTGRGLVLTNFGSEFYARCLGMAHEAQRIFEFAAQSREHLGGNLYIVYPPVIGASVIEHLAAEFALAQPGVRLHLEATTKLIDPRLIAADILLYFSFDELPDADFVARRLTQSPYLLVAKPSLLNGVYPYSPDDLRHYPRVSYGIRSHSSAWHLRRGDEIKVVDHPPVLLSTQISALIKACRMGVGIASLPHGVVHTDIARNQLVPVLPDWHTKQATLFAMYPSGRTLTAAARHFLDYLTDHFSQRQQHQAQETIVV